MRGGPDFVLDGAEHRADDHFAIPALLSFAPESVGQGAALTASGSRFPANGTVIVKMARAVGATIPFDWRLIVNGYLPDYAYAQGALDTRKPLPELKALAHIDERARAAGLSPEFSQLIRASVPSPREQP